MMDFLKEIKPREYQEKIAKTCQEKNCLVVLPTGLGKTLIALLVSIKRMQEYPGQKVVFLAPTRPLAEQHLKSFKKYLPELFGEMNLFTGQINSKIRKNLWDGSDIIFSTPQCVANDLKKNLYDLSEVCLLIEDEAHRCLNNYDYNYIAQRYKKDSQNPRLVGLTASPGSEILKIEQICKNLSIEEVEIRTRESEDVKKYLQEVKYERINIEYPEILIDIKINLKNLFEYYINNLKMRGLFHKIPTKVNLLELQRNISRNISGGNKSYSLFSSASDCAQAIKLQHAIELVETQTLFGLNEYLNKLAEEAKNLKSKGVVKLVEKSEFQFCLSRSKELLEKGYEHPKIDKLMEILEKEKSEDPKFKAIIFSQFRDTATIISKNLEKRKIKSKVFVGQAKKKTGEGSSGLSQKEQKNILIDFSYGEINVLCATSIAEEGLDIPEVNLVIFYEPIPSAIRKIQRAGRTARLKDGRVIFLVTKKTRDESFYYISNSREKKMYSEINKMKENLKQSKINQFLKDETI